MLISVVGVAGVLAFSLSGRTREFGIRLALGAQPRNIMNDVLLQGITIQVSASQPVSSSEQLAPAASPAT